MGGPIAKAAVNSRKAQLPCALREEIGPLLYGDIPWLQVSSRFPCLHRFAQAIDSKTSLVQVPKHDTIPGRGAQADRWILNGLLVLVMLSLDVEGVRFRIFKNGHHFFLDTRAVQKV